MEEITKILNNWIKEYIADAIAIYLFGPACFFGFLCLSESVNSNDSYSDKHPPLFFRVIPILSSLETLGFNISLKKYDVIKRILEKYNNIGKINVSDDDKKGIGRGIISSGSMASNS